jgi:MFS family permease
MTRIERTYLLVFGGYNLAQFFIAPVYPLFLLRCGLDLFQINVVLAVYLVTVFALEIPTGAFADRYGRRRSFLVACWVRALAYGLYASADSFADCLVAEMIDALGTTLASGALEAWAVDGVRAEGDRRPADGLLARANAVSRAAVIVGVIACGYLADRALVVPWLVAMSVFVVTAVVGALTMRESPAGSVSAAHPRRSLHRAVREDVGSVAANPVLLLLCVLTAAGAFAGFPLHMYWAPQLEAVSGAPPHLLGWVAALLNLAALTGSAVLPRLLDRARRSTVLAAAACWRAAMLALAAAATALSPMLAGLVLQEVAFGLTEPVLAGWTNEHVPSERRATLLSVRSTFFTLGGAAGLVLIGLVGRAAGVPTAWAVSAAVFAAIVPGYLLLERVSRRVSTAATVPA